jgi:putative endonuclease
MCPSGWTPNLTSGDRRRLAQLLPIKTICNMATWYVYMVLTEKAQFYTGITTDLPRRLQEHVDVYQGKTGAKGAKYFRTQKPLAIVYSCSFSERAEASRHEWEIKKLSKIQKTQLVNNPNIRN